MWTKIVIQLLDKGLTPSYIAGLLDVDTTSILAISWRRKKYIKEGKLETAKNLLEKGLDIDTIASFTDLTKDEIEHVSELLEDLQEDDLFF